MPSTNYNSPQISGEYLAYHAIKPTDWGILAPGATGTAFSAGGNLSASASGGSLPTSTGAFKVTYVTALGETTPSVEATVSVTGATGSVIVTVPANPQVAGNPELAAQTIVGWNVYSGNGAGNEQKNTGTNSDLNITLSTAGAPVSYIPIATTSVTVKVYGNGAVPPVNNTSGIQMPLPQVGANNSVDYFVTTNSAFRSRSIVEWVRPFSSSDPTALLVSAMDCIAPTWSASTAVTAYNGTAPANSSFVVLNGLLFGCTTAGTTGSTIPTGLTNAQTAVGTTVTDGTAVWTCLGRRGLIRVRFSNTSGTAGQPVAQEYDLFQI